jgi:hypothetical protein
MKNLLVILVLGVSLSAGAAETKEVCKPKLTKEGKEVLDKNKKPVMDCKTIKVHRKLDGTPVPSK